MVAMVALVFPNVYLTGVLSVWPFLVAFRNEGVVMT